MAPVDGHVSEVIKASIWMLKLHNQMAFCIISMKTTYIYVLVSRIEC